MATKTPPTDFTTLLQRAVTEPGLVSRAYTTFHGYSFGNQLLALVQCLERGIAPGPIATFMGWKALGRSVQKGQRAIVLCMPVTCTRRPTDEELAADAEATTGTFTRFVYRPHWFVLAQTEGADIASVPVNEWHAERALAELGIIEEPFALMDGNCQGYAHDRAIAVSPVAAHPHKTRFHELAHVVLGHTSEGQTTDDERTPRSLREVEAEAVALVCLEALGLPGAEYCRGYIQRWNAERGSEPIPERGAQKIFKAADAILRAGRAAADVEAHSEAA
jgi:hypothetical protein